MKKEWQSGKVVGGFKKTSKHKHCKHILIGEDLIVERDFENGIEEWKEAPAKDETENVEDISDTFIMTKENEHHIFPVKIIPSRDYHKPEVQEAMQSEISKYKSFEANEYSCA